MLRDVLIIVKLLELAMFDFAKKNGYFIWMEFADHLCLLPSV